jgi:cytosine/adenosine deaminase-related metal-dependent hydrolase
MAYALLNVRIYDYDNYEENGYIVFSDKIIDKGKMSDYLNKGYEEFDLMGKLVIPGFVCGHTHLYSTFARGMSFDFNPNNFVDILKQLWWKVDHFLDKDLIYYSSLIGGLNQMSFGTTTLIDHHASGEISGSLKLVKSALVNRLGLRCVTAFETSDRFDVDEAIKENIAGFNLKEKFLANSLFGMHASLSLSDKSLAKISKVLGDKGIHIHVAESVMDEDECLEKYGMRVVQRLEKFNLLNERSILVHCTHINEEEMDIIKKYDSTIAVNVTSNLNNAVGISQIKRFLDKGIRVISGNDGLIPSQAVEYMNIFYLSHLKESSPIGFSFSDLKKIIRNTYDYANSLLGTKLGIIEKDCEADLLVIDFNNLTPVDEFNIFSHLFYGVFPGLRPNWVIARGKIKFKDYNEFEDYSLDKKEGIIQAKRLWTRINEGGKDVKFKY